MEESVFFKELYITNEAYTNSVAMTDELVRTVNKVYVTAACWLRSLWRWRTSSVSTNTAESSTARPCGV